MKTRNSISAFMGVDFSTFPVGQNLKPKSKFVMRCATIILVALLFLPVLAFTQEDTLILLGSYTGMYQSNAVSAYNENAFVADARGLVVIDYSDPYDPDSITCFTEGAVDVEIRDSLAYYVDVGVLYIRDISNPLESEIVGWCTGYFWDNIGFRVHLFDTLALVMHKTGIETTLLKLIDISDPTDPQVLSTMYPPPSGTMHWGDANKKDNYVYWADRAFIFETGVDLGRIIVFDITDPTDPLPIVVDTCLGGVPFAIWIKDSYAYVAEGYGGRGLVVLDISDPYNIDSVGCFPIPEGRAWNVYIKGKYAYVCAHLKPTLEWDRVYVLDISDPTNPSLVTYYNTPGSPRDVFVDELYVLVADYTSLLVFEASFLHTIPGDVNGDGQVDIGDVVFLVNYLYKGGPPPEIPELGDVNGDSVVDLGDVVYLINYLFRDGPVPEKSCPTY